MNKTITKAVGFVKKNKTVLAASAGVVTGASIAYYACYHNLAGRTFLEVTAAHVDHMRENGVALLYETPDFGAVMLTVPKHP